jgi:type IV pilus assembly protein PilN
MLINLLPHREARRHRRRRAFRKALALSAGLGLLPALLGFAGLQQRTAAQQQRNEMLAAEVAALEVPVQAAAKLRADIAALQLRRQALDDLAFQRTRPVRLLEALARHTPAGVQLASLRQHGDDVTLAGSALGSPEVAALLSALAQAHPLLQQPTLVEMKAVAGAESRRRFDFTLELRLQRPPAAVHEAAPAAAGADAPASARPLAKVS